MDRLGHQQQSRRDIAAAFSSGSIAHMIGARGHAGVRNAATKTE